MHHEDRNVDYLEIVVDPVWDRTLMTPFKPWDHKFSRIPSETFAPGRLKPYNGIVMSL